MAPSLGRVASQSVSSDQRLMKAALKKYQLLFAVENCDRRFDPVERPVIGLHLALEFALRGFDVGHVDCGSGRHAVDGEYDDVVGFALAAGNQMDAGLVALSGRNGFGDSLTLPGLEQFDLAFENFKLALGVDGVDVGGVDPD